jgi:hypothetical protein
MIRRRAADVPLELRRVAGAEARDLLGAAFLGYLESATRLATQLDVCSRLAAERRLLEVHVPASLGARETAEFLHERLPETLAW